MKLLLLVIVLVAAVAAIWFFGPGRDTAPARETRTGIEAGAERLRDRIAEQLESFSLRPEEIREELSRSGSVVREKTREIGATIADATAETRTTAAIKAKFVRDPELAARHISVNTTGNVVTLSGHVASHEQIGRAILLALEVDGVREVISTLQIRQIKTEPAESADPRPVPQEPPPLPADPQ
jgi:hypothetical protein